MLGSLKRHGSEEQMETYAVLKEAFLSGEAGSVEQVSAFKKSVTGRVETDFYRNSVRMGKECEKDGGYWNSNTEMTARAFACYIKDKLPYSSDYLAGHADCAVTFVAEKSGEMAVLKAFPKGEERRAINAVFDEIVADLKREQVLTHSDETLPLSAQPLAENEQISIFTADRPSVMAQLAAVKPAEKTTLAQTAPKKSHTPEI